MERLSVGLRSPLFLGNLCHKPILNHIIPLPSKSICYCSAPGCPCLFPKTFNISLSSMKMCLSLVITTLKVCTGLWTNGSTWFSFPFFPLISTGYMCIFGCQMWFLQKSSWKGCFEFTIIYLHYVFTEELKEKTGKNSIVCMSGRWIWERGRWSEPFNPRLGIYSNVGWAFHRCQNTDEETKREKKKNITLNV